MLVKSTILFLYEIPKNKIINIKKFKTIFGVINFFIFEANLIAFLKIENISIIDKKSKYAL